MSKILAISLQITFATFFIGCSFSVVGQELDGAPNIAPPKHFGKYTCKKPGSVDPTLTFKIKAGQPPFEAGNIFSIELSDKNGDFPSEPDPTRFVGSVANQNTNYQDIPASFQLPSGTFGESYRVRIVSSKPARIGEPSTSFEAYDMISDLRLNNRDDLYICGKGNTGELKLNTDLIASYMWYRDGVLVTTTTEPKLAVSQSGRYQAKIDYGLCGTSDSTISNVFVTDTSNTRIKGDNEVELCSDQTYTFESEETNSEYTYSWFKDGVQVASSNSSTYTTPSSAQFGTYYLEILVNGCSSRSQDVVLKQKSSASFTITNNFTEKVILLPKESKELKINIEPTSSSVDILWYKDGEQLSVFGNSLNAIEPGNYFARVTEKGTSCSFTQDSEIFELVGIKGLDVTIRTANDYVECKSLSTNLVMVGVGASGTDDNQYQLSEKQIQDNVSYQWFKNDEEIDGATTRELSISSYFDNDLYKLVAKLESFEDDSNIIDLKLSIKEPEITSTSTSNSLCPQRTINLTVSELVDGFTYTWLKDDVKISMEDPKKLEVNEIGTYKLQISGNGCIRDLDPINIIPFNDAAVVISPSEYVVLLSGEPTVISVGGAESYEWYDDESGDLLSTNDRVEVNKVGNYSLIATVGDCQVRKTVEVVEQDDQVIVPNILSPRTVDGINDTWQISNRYAFQPSVIIIIYDSSGNEILRTSEYKNDWPSEDLGNQKIFYFKIIRDDKLVKAGVISVID